MAYNPYKMNGYSMPCFNINNDLFQSKIEAFRSTRATKENQSALSKKFTELKSKHDEAAKLQEKRLSEAISLIEAQQNEIEALRSKVTPTMRATSTNNLTPGPIKDPSTATDRETFNRRVMLRPQMSEHTNTFGSHQQQQPGRAIEFAQNKNLSNYGSRDQNENHYSTTNGRIENEGDELSDRRIVRKRERQVLPPRAKQTPQLFNKYKKRKIYEEDYESDENDDYDEMDYVDGRNSDYNSESDTEDLSSDSDYSDNDDNIDKRNQSKYGLREENDANSDSEKETNKEQFERRFAVSKPGAQKLKSVIKRTTRSRKM